MRTCSPVCKCIYLSIRPPICPSISSLTVIHPITRPPTHPSTHPFILPTPSVYLSIIRPSIHPSIIHPSTHPSVHRSIHRSVCQSGPALPAPSRAARAQPSCPQRGLFPHHSGPARPRLVSGAAPGGRRRRTVLPLMFACPCGCSRPTRVSGVLISWFFTSPF